MDSPAQHPTVKRGSLLNQQKHLHLEKYSPSTEPKKITNHGFYLLLLCPSVCQLEMSLCVCAGGSRGVADSGFPGHHE